MNVVHINILIVFSIKNPISFSTTGNHKSYKPFPPNRVTCFLVTHYDYEDNQQNTLQKYPINQVTACESEPQDIESTTIVATLYSKA